MSKYIVVHNEESPSGIIDLVLQPKRKRDALSFYPGQYACIGFRQGGRPTPMRCFSIVSSPNDRERLQFGIRRQGRFTSSIAQLQPGKVVTVRGPFGDFVIDEQYDRSVVMLAGGIGITPFISTLRYAADVGLNTPITLLYSCRGRGGIPFFDELVALENRNPRLRVVFFVTDNVLPQDNGARIISGRIDENWVQRATRESFKGSTYFLCGPKGFVGSLRKQLSGHNVDEGHILTESFTQTGATPVLGSRFSLQTWTYAFAALVLLFGTGAIMTLDLMRAVPRLASTTATTSQTSTPTSANTTSGTQNNTSNSTSTTTPATPSSSSSASTSSSPSSPTPTYQYQAPVTSVS